MRSMKMLYIQSKLFEFVNHNMQRLDEVPLFYMGCGYGQNKIIWLRVEGIVRPF